MLFGDDTCVPNGLLNRRRAGEHRDLPQPLSFRLAPLIGSHRPQIRARHLRDIRLLERRDRLLLPPRARRPGRRHPDLPGRICHLLQHLDACPQRLPGSGVERARGRRGVVREVSGCRTRLFGWPSWGDPSTASGNRPLTRWHRGTFGSCPVGVYSQLLSSRYHRFRLGENCSGGPCLWSSCWN